jgi:IMP dehydrogenase
VTIKVDSSQGSASIMGAPRRRASKVDTIRQAYGFDDVSLAPGTTTVEPADVDTSIRFAGLDLGIPLLAASMDAVVDVRSATVLAGLGGLAVMNLEGVQMRYEDPAPVLERIARADPEHVQEVLSAAYEPAIAEDIVAARIRELHEASSPAVISATPAAARRWGPFCRSPRPSTWPRATSRWSWTSSRA